MIKFEQWFTTAGDGYWTRKKKRVYSVGFDLAYANEHCDFGELRVYFDPVTWNTSLDGLIYTDSQFLRELQVELTKLGLTGSDVDYSEQGMQGNNYVSCDVGEKFIDSLASRYPEEFVGMIAG